MLLIFMVFFAVRMWTTRDAIEGPAPPFEGFTVNGPYTSLASQRGKPVLVHFWATWCPVCKAEQDSIESIAADHQVITIAMKSGSPADVHKFLRDEGLTFPTLVDPDGTLARQYGVNGVPSSFVIDAAGNIRFVEVGYSTEAGLRGRLWLAESGEKPADGAPRAN
ncbi:MAG: protein disulfide oxidoreductase [Gammaproteobacteria bacterium]